LTTGRYYTPSNRLIQRDYSEGFLDYYAHRGNNDNAQKEQPRHFTDGGRLVYGGGGITPDEIVKPDRAPVAVRKLQGRNLFRTYASEVYAGKTSSSLPVEVSDANGVADEREIERLMDLVQVDAAILQDFRRYAAEQGVRINDEEWKASENIIANLLRQELLLLAVGDEASYRVALQLDRQVQRALELIPQVNAILQSAISQAKEESASLH